MADGEPSSLLRAETPSLAFLSAVGPRLSAIAKNERAKGEVAFKMLVDMHRRQIGAGRTEALFKEAGYDAELRGITVDEVTKAAVEAGFETLEQAIEEASKTEGENAKLARSMGLIK